MIWVDIEACAVHRYDPISGLDQSFVADGRVGFAAPRADRGLVLAVEHRFAIVDDPGGPARTIATVEPGTPTRMNDGNCDSRGRLFAGTMALDERTPCGALYRLDPDGSVETLLEGVTVSNGIDWAPDGGTMYFVDSVTQTIDAFEFDPDQGRISNRRPFARVPPDAGLPDGLTVDTDGGIWVAVWGGWAVRRYSPAGELVGVIRLPTQNITSCAFGGDELADLYVTSARADLTDNDLLHQPEAGSVFCLRPGATGRLHSRFNG
jgi:sugar lactone lactonase YvrE